MLKGKKIVLGVTGSIAAYKAAMLVRLLVKEGAEVQVVMTPSAKEFITPLTLSTLSGRPVISEFFSTGGTWNSHVEIGMWADAMVIAPATASSIGKMANGIADNMLVTTYLSMKAPVFVAPAMDLDMYAHPSTARNIDILRSYGNHIIEPGEGELASHLKGKGRMEEPEKIVSTLKDFFFRNNSLAGKKIVITAGPTYEKIDPVRFIGNYSSGKMGFALAEECALQGADVTLIAGPVQLPTPNSAIKRIDVESAEEMYNAATAAFADSDAAILCAAVADYRPVSRSDEKIKRGEGAMTIELAPNKDIAAALGEQKKPHQRIAGFALETNNEESNAHEKLKRKNLDFIVLNSLRDKGAGFAVDTNKITIIDSNGKTEYPLKSKRDVARDIVAHLGKLFAMLLLLLMPFAGNAQELSANVTLNSDKIQGTNAEVFEVLGTALEEFINNRQWTGLKFEENERINCSFNFIVDTYSNDGSFTATLIVQSNRPIYGTSYNSPLFQYEDKGFPFKYQPHDRLEFNEEYIDNNLTAVIAFYAYLIIGLDFDSMGEMGGSEFLNKAMTIANNSQSLGDGAWRSSAGTNNRFAIIDDYLNGALEPVRKMMYRYHRLGLDTMFKNAEGGRKIIGESFNLLAEAYENRSQAYFPQLFTEYKRDEIVNIYSFEGGFDEKKKVTKILYDIAPALSSSWDKIKTE